MKIFVLNQTGKRIEYAGVSDTYAVEASYEPQEIRFSGEFAEREMESFKKHMAAPAFSAVLVFPDKKVLDAHLRKMKDGAGEKEDESPEAVGESELSRLMEEVAGLKKELEKARVDVRTAEESRDKLKAELDQLRERLKEESAKPPATPAAAPKKQKK